VYLIRLRGRGKQGIKTAGLAHFKVPCYIWLVERFPMTGSGKLQKVTMREEVLVRLKRDRLSKES